MTIFERSQSTQALMEECAAIMVGKEVDYASKEDTMANFKRIGERVGLTKYQIWSVYFGKHADAIANAVKYHPEAPRTADESEPLRGRICDAINYLTILANLMDEDVLEKTRAPRADRQAPGHSRFPSARRACSALREIFFNRPAFDTDFQEVGFPGEVTHTEVPWTKQS